jgi:LacI family transcriptional regulator|tara:strand:+ start:1739 stop:2875 length:1137 start_codon:yes stop_codon:yes gene_type:complete
MAKQVAIVMTEVFLRRLTPSLIPFVRRQHDFRILSIRRPIEELRSLLLELKPSALITEWLPKTTEALLEIGIPTVIADTDYRYRGATSIDVDDWEVGAQAARAFTQAGYRHFACLGNSTPYSKQRIEGFQRELGAHTSISTHQEDAFDEARYSEDFFQPQEELRLWLAALPKPVAIFAMHDPLGRYLCNACRRLNLRVPDEVAIIGANNDELVCGLSYPMLSSVSIPWNTIGETVGEAMRSLLAGEGPPSNPILIQPSGVILRHSANHLAIEDPILRSAMSYFSKRIQDPITVEILCDELRIARRSLERKFREYYQCTPWEMLCRLRINRAKQLLTGTNHSISAISELCGFNDPERLAVVFKRIEGKPPSKFRAKSGI